MCSCHFFSRPENMDVMKPLSRHQSPGNYELAQNAPCVISAFASKFCPKHKAAEMTPERTIQKSSRCHRQEDVRADAFMTVGICSVVLEIRVTTTDYGAAYIHLHATYRHK